jgi:hypothetical protein
VEEETKVKAAMGGFFAGLCVVLALSCDYDDLDGIPAGFADGVDDQVNFVSSGPDIGVAETAARSDHTHPDYVLKTGDSMSGPLDMSGTQTVTNLATPTNGSDAATKDYVDAHVHFPDASQGDTLDTLGTSGIYVYPGSVFTPSTNKRALVTIDASIPGTETVEGPYMRVAMKVGATDTNDGDFGFYFAPMSNGGPSHMSRTAYFNLTANSTYRFGAYISGSSAWSGRTVRVRCTYMLFDR